MLYMVVEHFRNGEPVASRSSPWARRNHRDAERLTHVCLGTTRLLRWFALLSALAVPALLVFLPLYRYEQVGGDGRTLATGTETLVEANGPYALIVLAIPVLAALCAVLPFPARYRRAADVTSAAIVAASCVLGSMTIGMFFVPAAAALAWIALTGRRTSRTI